MEAQEAGLELAAEKLAGELADVEASIALVSTGVATRVTLTGMRFGRQVRDRLQPAALRQGITLEASFWPEDDICDVSVAKIATGAESPGAALRTTNA
jgi:hypothetical protein